MKKIIKIGAIVATSALAVTAMTSCGGYKDDGVFRVGFICLHDENSTYDANFIDAAKAVKKEYNLSDEQVIIKTGIPEGKKCYNEAVKLVGQGCDVIFADSFGHEDYLLKAAEKYPEVQFCHATGTQAHTSNLKNVHNAFASIYEGRYLAGVAAGFKMLEDSFLSTAPKASDDKIGYVGAFTYAEVISGYTAYYLGANAVYEAWNGMYKDYKKTLSMDVTFTGSWYDYTAENEAAKKLIDNGCTLISGHADSMGVPDACDEKSPKIPNVSYNGMTGKTSNLAMSKIDWRPYFRLIMKEANKNSIPVDYTGTLSDGSVAYQVNYDMFSSSTIAAGVYKELVKTSIEEIEKEMKEGKYKVFDTEKFTVGGKKLTTYMADVDTDAAFTPDTEVIEGGQFKESAKRSAPYFNVQIDGIKLLDPKF